jgi:hypothetical protein
VLGNNGTAAAPAGPIPARIQSTANQTFYVNANSGGTPACGPTGASTCSAGNDSNNCLTPATACLTLQHVVNLVIFTIDLNGFTVTTYLAHGTSPNYSFTCYSGPVVGQSTMFIVGDTNSTSAVKIQAPHGGNGITVKDGCTVGLTAIAFAENSDNSTVDFIDVGAGNYGHLDANTLTFGSCANCNAIEAEYAGSVTFNDSGSSATGNEAALLFARVGGTIDFGGNTFAGASSLTFSNATAVITRGGIINATSSTFAGFASINAQRCTIAGPYDFGGATSPNSIFPGNSSCALLNVVDGGTGLTALGTGVQSGLANNTNGANGIIVAGSNGAAAVANGGTGTTSAGATAANNIGALAEANNLSDLASASSARSNLGLGALATVSPGSGVATALGSNTNASGGFPTVPVANSNLANASTTVAGQTCTLGSICGLSTASNALSGDVSLNNIANYFDGPSMAQGSTGTWQVTGHITVSGNSNDIIRCKLWDGTNTAIDATQFQVTGANPEASITLSGQMSSPAGNMRVSCRNVTSTTGSAMQANASNNGNHDSTIYGFRIN